MRTAVQPDMEVHQRGMGRLAVGQMLWYLTRQFRVAWDVPSLNFDKT